jgi:hypothetical protein
VVEWTPLEDLNMNRSVGEIYLSLPIMSTVKSNEGNEKEYLALRDRFDKKKSSSIDHFL